MKVATPLLVPVLAALPVCACMVILGLPSFGHGYATAFRTLFFIACLAWLIPLTLLQRAMWRREWPWLRMALVVLASSYVMSVLNAVLGQRLAISLGLGTNYHWAELLRGLDGCWLPLIAFCAVHAVAVSCAPAAPMCPPWRMRCNSSTRDPIRSPTWRNVW